MALASLIPSHSQRDVASPWPALKAQSPRTRGASSHLAVGMGRHSDRFIEPFSVPSAVDVFKPVRQVLCVIYPPRAGEDTGAQRGQVTCRNHTAGREQGRASHPGPHRARHPNHCTTQLLSFLPHSLSSGQTESLQMAALPLPSGPLHSLTAPSPSAWLTPAHLRSGGAEAALVALTTGQSPSR